MKRHHDELNDGFPYDPDWDNLFQMATVGMLRVWVARSNGAIIGYAFCVISPSIRSRTNLFATINPFWLAPEWREGWTGYHLLKGCVEALRKLGVVAVDTYTARQNPRADVIFRRLGFDAISTGHRKVM